MTMLILTDTGPGPGFYVWPSETGEPEQLSYQVQSWEDLRQRQQQYDVPPGGMKGTQGLFEEMSSQWGPPTAEQEAQLFGITT